MSTWDALRTYQSNAKKAGPPDDDVAAALQEQSVHLARALVAKEADLNLAGLTQAQRGIADAVSEYVGIKQLQGRYPGRTLMQLRNRGLIDAAEVAVSSTKPKKGYQDLANANLADLSFEQIVMDHPDEFSARAQWFSSRTLGLPIGFSKPPAKLDGDTQTRTAVLLKWLRDRAAGNGGVIAPFTYATAALAAGMKDMQSHGQVYGNLQSRIDFACYVAGLPPLGCAAEAPFDKAWAQEGRTWSFPVKGMQAAAQGRAWNVDDFERIMRETEQLPAQAHVSWHEEIGEREEAVRAWAEKFGDVSSADEGAELKRKGTRNPVWTREELLLGLQLYLHHRASLLPKDSPEVIELSVFLGEIAKARGVAAVATYRNATGVYMKMMNFRRFDPAYIKGGKVGLVRANKDEGAVWSKFADDLPRLDAVCSAIRAAVHLPGSNNFLGGDDETDIEDAEEGRVLTRLHRTRERSRKLVEAAKRAAMKKHGRLFCSACGFSFDKRYGSTYAGIIDVHHTKPVHTLPEGHKTKIEDLALLCANCHRVVHSSRSWLTVAQVTELVGSRA